MKELKKIHGHTGHLNLNQLLSRGRKSQRVEHFNQRIRWGREISRGLKTVEVNGKIPGERPKLKELIGSERMAMRTSIISIRITGPEKST